MSPSQAATPRRLVIVESPAKARKIAGYLGDGYEVEASVGHIRDLPQPSELPADMKKGPYGKFAVDVDDGFEPYYRVYPDKKKKVAELKKLLKDADELLLATDNDREGEAIAWHLLQVLSPKVPVKRMVFGEITKDAIMRALENTRDLDSSLVDAQETRRILDRLYGYEVSPVLWRKVGPGLSAGRVQSVGVRLVVERERERMAFRSAAYWDLTASVTPTTDHEPFTARLVGVDGDKVATGRDFDDRGGLKSGSKAVALDEATVRSLAEALESAPVGTLGVKSLETKPYKRRPAAPFTTSTLQQEAGRKLRLSARATMSTAQSLYENGYITYMRTDSPQLSGQAISAARRQAAELYGSEFVPEKPRVYQGKDKNAQEAHEAIRPAGDQFQTPAQIAGKLHGNEFRLYDLIWKRTVASQMADARGSTASARLSALLDLPAGRRSVELAASGTVITFRGFLAAYEEGRDAARYDDADKDGDSRLPELAEGQKLDVLVVTPDGHETSPPPRYTEASLVKALEELGIGRPSTYASTISTIQDRGYVRNRGNALVPSWVAFSVVRLLEEHFARFVNYRFTAEMEDDLDTIAGGRSDRAEWLHDFYFGRAGAEKLGLKEVVDSLGDIDARALNSIEIADGITLRVGRYGPYLEVAGEDGAAKRVSVPDDLSPDELTAEKARELVDTQVDSDRELGTDPQTGRTIVAKSGRFGPYVTEVIPDDAGAASSRTDGKSESAGDKATAKNDAKGGAKTGTTGGKKKAAKKEKPRTASLFKSMDPATVTLEQALQLLSQPRVVGEDPESGEPITAQNGRYGPYLKKGTDSRSLTDEEQIFAITLDEALRIYAEPKRRGRQSAAALRELGTDPASEKPVVVKDGRFGPYVTDGATNATLRKADTVEDITLERAAELLAEKRAKGPAKKKPAAKK